MNVAQLIRSYTLWEFIQAHWLTLKYFFKPKATINYPFEKNPLTIPNPCPRCASTMPFRLNVPAHSTTQMRMKPIETS